MTGERRKIAFYDGQTTQYVTPNTPLPLAKGHQLVKDATITSGQSLSAAVDLGVYRAVGLSIPATFEPTTISFQASYDGSTWNNIYKDGIEVTEQVSTSRRIVLDPAKFYGVRYIKIRGGTSATPTTVAANRTIKIIAEA